MPPRSPAAPPGPWAAALAGAALHWVVLAAVQVENAAHLAAGPAAEGAAWILAALPLLQLENAAFCAGLALVLRVLAAVPAGALAAGAVVLACNLYAVLDQIGYELTFTHFRWSDLEESPADLVWLRDSVLHLLDGTFYVNLVLVAAAAVLHGAVLRGRVRPGAWLGALGRPRLSRRQGALAGLAYLAACLVAAGRIEHLDVGSNPALTLVRDAVARAEPAAPPAVTPVAGYAVPSAPPGPRTVTRPAVPARDRRNVVLVVLESIGAKQLLAGGRPDPAVAPFLHALSRRGVVFDAVYAPYPATIVSNIAITTGGPSLTWEQVRSLRYPYRGATLVGELGRGGFATALFSSADLDFGNLDRFFAPLGFNHLHDFGQAGTGFRVVNESNSWGGSDETTLELAAAWARARHRERRPFYLRIQTNLAHHPYNVPEGYPEVVPHADPEKARYLTAIRYLDGLLARFHAELAAAGIAAHTVFAFTGDHGEAFGEWHGTNFLHRNHLYDENVRSFLILSAPGLGPGGEVDSTPASHGDVMPTVLGASGVGVPDGVFGQDLLAADYRPRVQFFHKNNHPEQWGLRDGRWKFIASFTGDIVELYDLEQDPHEQVNLAAQHPERVADYARRCATWYVAQNQSFARNLEGRPDVGEEDYEYADFAEAGPKILHVGYLAEAGREERFRAATRLHPGEALFAWTKWVSYRERTAIEYRVIGPGGEHRSARLRVGPDAVVTRTALPMPDEPAPGQWRVEIHDAERRLLATEFELSPSVPVRNPARIRLDGDAIRLVARATGATVAATPHDPAPADQRLAIAVDWAAPAAADRLVTVRWRSPRGRRLEYRARVRAGERESAIVHHGPYPMAPGPWWLTLWDGPVELGRKVVVVAPAGRREERELVAGGG